jgi:hypothetical protein
VLHFLLQRPLDLVSEAGLTHRLCTSSRANEFKRLEE